MTKAGEDAETAESSVIRSEEIDVVSAFPQPLLEENEKDIPSGILRKSSIWLSEQRDFVPGIFKQITEEEINPRCEI